MRFWYEEMSSTVGSRQFCLRGSKGLNPFELFSAEVVVRCPAGPPRRLPLALVMVVFAREALPLFVALELVEVPGPAVNDFPLIVIEGAAVDDWPRDALPLTAPRNAPRPRPPRDARGGADITPARGT